jgi:hypothetical protein
VPHRVRRAARSPYSTAPSRGPTATPMVTSRTSTGSLERSPACALRPSIDPWIARPDRQERRSVALPAHSEREGSLLRRRTTDETYPMNLATPVRTEAPAHDLPTRPPAAVGARSGSSREPRHCPPSPVRGDPFPARDAAQSAFVPRRPRSRSSRARSTDSGSPAPAAGSTGVRNAWPRPRMSLSTACPQRQRVRGSRAVGRCRGTAFRPS